MRADYKILWFEDIKSSFDAKKNIVKDIVEEFGFDFPEPQNEVDGENIDKILYDDFDLIIADLNLAGVKGPALIDKIRHNDGIFTEVVFYSSDGEKAVRDALKNFEIDGAYCAGRENDDFEEKVRKVIRNTIKKVQDVNNMRGLIMAGVSDLDSKMIEIINIILEKHPKKIQVSLVDKIFQDVGSSVKEKGEKYSKLFESKDIGKLLGDTLMFDSAKRLSAIQYIIEAIDHEIFNDYKKGKFTEVYKQEVGEARNIFAHVVLILENGVKKLKSKSKEIVFTDEYCTDVRRNLRKHLIILDGIKEQLLKV